MTAGGAAPAEPQPSVTVQITEYKVSCLPEEMDFIGGDHWALTVAYRGRDRWAVLRDARRCLARDGSWSYESIPSEREDEWLTAHRFGRDEALELATRVAPDVRVNGLTPADVLRMEAERG